MPDLSEAVAGHAISAGEKLRAQGSVCHAVIREKRGMIFLIVKNLSQS